MTGSPALIALVLLGHLGLAPLAGRPWRPGWSRSQWSSVLTQGYETYAGPSQSHGWETICVPAKDARPDRYTFVHPDLGPDYLCRRISR